MITDKEKMQFSIEPIAQNGLPRREREHEAVVSLIHGNISPTARLEHFSDGSPYIPGCPYNISLSHSRRFAALAWSDKTNVGIDVEEPRFAQLERVASRFLTENEKIGMDDYPTFLLKVWTLKEAAFKALRNGPVDFRQYQVCGDKILVDGAELEVLFSDFIRDDLFCSIVACDTQKEIEKQNGGEEEGD